MATPKYLGFDCELSTSGLDRDGIALDPLIATRNVLARIGTAFEATGSEPWTRSQGWSASPSAYSQDCLRHWAPNGQCFYCDLGHVEVCGAATLAAHDYAAQCIAALTVAEEARARAEEEEDGSRYVLTAANIDTLDPGVSWGTHLDLCLDPELWEDLFLGPRRPPVFGFVSSAMAAIVPFFGAGYLLPFEGSVIFSLSARAHHVTRPITLSTTEAYGRGLLNSRREGHGEGHERLHVISTDFSLISAALKGALIQCVCAAAEDSFCGLNLLEPVRAMRQWSWGFDPETSTLPILATLADGRRLTLPEYVRELGEVLLSRVEAGLIDDSIAPDAGELLAKVIDLTHWLEEGADSFSSCARHLDWAAKWMYLRALEGQHGTDLSRPSLRLADHDFTRTNLRGGAFWRLWEQGLVDPLVERSAVEAFLADGPPETRAWARGRLIQRFGSELTDVDWSRIELRLSDSRWAPRLRIDLPKMTSLKREIFEPLLERAQSVAHLGELLKCAGGVEVETLDAYLGNRTRYN